MIKRAPDLTGQEFDHLVVISRANAGGHGKGAAWLCRCDCGAEVVKTAKFLSREDRGTKHCGCRTPVRQQQAPEPKAPKSTPEAAARDLAEALGINAMRPRLAGKTRVHTNLLDAECAANEIAASIGL